MRRREEEGISSPHRQYDIIREKSFDQCVHIPSLYLCLYYSRVAGIFVVFIDVRCPPGKLSNLLRVADTVCVPLRRVQNCHRTEFYGS